MLGACNKEIESRQKTKIIEEVTLFCYCQQLNNDNGEKMGCDNPNRPVSVTSFVLILRSATAHAEAKASVR